MENAQLKQLLISNISTTTDSGSNRFENTRRTVLCVLDESGNCKEVSGPKITVSGPKRLNTIKINYGYKKKFDPYGVKANKYTAFTGIKPYIVTDRDRTSINYNPSIYTQVMVDDFSELQNKKAENSESSVDYIMEEVD